MSKASSVVKKKGQNMNATTEKLIEEADDVIRGLLADLGFLLGVNQHTKNIPSINAARKLRRKIYKRSKQ